MNKSISIVLAFTLAVLLVNFGETYAACSALSTSSTSSSSSSSSTTSSSSSTSTPSPDTDPVGYCRQFYTAPANPNADCKTGGDSACHGGLVCIHDGDEPPNRYYRCECPIYKTIQSQIYANNNYQCTSPLLDGSTCFFKSGLPCAGSWFCASFACSNHVCN